MMKNGLYFIVIALLVAELFKILIYANEMSVTSQKGHKVMQNHKKLNISLDFFCMEQFLHSSQSSMICPL